ncbi:MAG: Clp protease N-terminal domain-containing protein [Solirubrobacteraceae bacterium]
MSERFSKAAKQALERALEQAVALGHDQVATEHLLLGLLGEEDGVPVRALGRHGVEAEALRAELIRMIGGGEPGPSSGDEVATPPTFAAWLGTALTLASAEAMADGRAIEVTDFLVALAQDLQSPAGWVLAELGVDRAALWATAEHLRLLDREIDRVGREMHEAGTADQLVRAGDLRDQRRRLIDQRTRKVVRGPPPDGESSASG